MTTSAEPMPLRLILLGAIAAAVAHAPGARRAPDAPPPPLPGRVVDLVAGDFYFRSPDTIPAGLTTFRLRSVQGGHAAWILRIPPGRDLRDVVAPAHAGKPPAWARNLGGPGFPPEGGTANATMVLEPGEYVVLCYVAGRSSKGKPHHQLGMYRRLVVAPAPRTPGALPKADVVVTMVDHAYRVSAPIRPGRRVLRVVNAGTALHEFKLLRVKPGHTAQESFTWKPESGTPPPDEEVTTIATLSPGGEATTTVDFTAGEYTIFCVPQEKHAMRHALRVAAAPARGR